MSKSTKKTKLSRIKEKTAVKYTAMVIAGLIALFLLFLGGYSIVFAKKVYFNQYIAGENLSGKNKAEARAIIESKIKGFPDQEISLVYILDRNKDKVYPLKPTDIALNYDIDASLNNIWDSGRKGNPFVCFWNQASSIFKKTNHTLVYSIDQESLDKKIGEIASALDQPEKDFSIVYNGSQFELNKEKQEGRRINQDRIKEIIKREIMVAKTEEIDFTSDNYIPQVTEENANKRLAEANKILEAGELNLKALDREYKIDLDSIGAFVKSRPNKDDLEIYFDDERLKIYIQSLAQNINVAPQNTTIALVNGTVGITKSATFGKELDQTQTRVDIQNALFARIPGKTASADPVNISLKIAVNKPEITDDTINTLGITELIGTGMTDFRKSSTNRVHNIQIGSAAINGSLLKPGETFSTLKKLGTIDASSGYLEELVIKDNSTIPEFGGGLCQVSSTLFRAAMNAGLKITERQNHKYRVSYYEPPVGMDATIYDPAPDFKFQNNYDKYILIQSRIEGTKITFDIFGTKDGRVAELSTPELYDIVEPGPPVMVNTDTLPLGEKKQLEKAHQGASAKFSYKVTKGGETLQEKTFISKYTPWPEKWLVGTGAVPVPVTDPNAVVTPTS